MKCDRYYNAIKCEKSARHFIQVMSVYDPHRVEHQSFLCDKHAYPLIEKSKKHSRRRKIVAKCPVAYITSLAAGGRNIRKGKFV